MPDSLPSRHNSTPHSTISSHNNTYNNYIGQDVPRPVNHPSRLATYSVYPSTLETHVSNHSSNSSQHGVTPPLNRLRTSNTVFQTGEELALHYGIPTLLPPPPQITSRPQERPQSTSHFSTLCANYLNMLSQNPADNTMSADCPSDLHSSPHMEHLGDVSLDSLMSALSSSPLLNMEEFLTSPLPFGTPLQDFESSPNETPFAEFLSTPLLEDSVDPLLTSPVIDYDRPLFEADEVYPPEPTSVKTKSAELPSGLHDLYTMSPIGPDVIDPSSLYPSPSAPTSETFFPPIDQPPAQSSAPSETMAAGVPRRRGVATGTRKNINPDKLIPLDAPTQPRRYLMPSVTSKKEIPAIFLRKRQRSELGDEEDELLEPPPPNATERDLIEYKRRQNTLAARKSRKRKLMHQQELETRVQALETEVDVWKTRCDVLTKLLQSSGIPPPAFD